MARSPSEAQEPIVLEPAALPVDWDVQEEEWAHHLSVVLGEAVELRVIRSRLLRAPGSNSECYEYSVDSTPALAPIQLHWTPRGVLVLLPPSPEREPSRAIWESAIKEATLRLGTASRTFEWVAYVADTSRTDLLGPATLGDLKLEPSGEVFHEVDSSQQPRSFSGWGMNWSYPVKVSGKASGVRWHTASRPAGEDLYRLCAVLSVVFGSFWVVKEFARPLELGEPTLPSLAGYLASEVVPSSENLDRRPTEVPEGLSNAWERAGEPWLAGPLSAHYRGLAYELDDPATAMTLFVAAIEGVGGRYVPLEPCACGTTRVGARKRFRHALGLVMSREEAKPLVGLYDLRSGAAHGDLIPGQPLSAGARTWGGWFYTSPEHELRIKVRYVKEASTRILELALLGGLAEPELGDPDPADG